MTRTQWRSETCSRRGTADGSSTEDAVIAENTAAQPDFVGNTRRSVSFHRVRHRGLVVTHPSRHAHSRTRPLITPSVRPPVTLIGRPLIIIPASLHFALIVWTSSNRSWQLTTRSQAGERGIFWLVKGYRKGIERGFDKFSIVIIKN